MNIQLSEHFNYNKLLRFVFPSIIMMIFTSIYGVVDGLFVSNYVGKTSFAAVNLIMPIPMLLSAVGFMIGTGGSAIVSKTLGEGKKKEANQYFSMLVFTTIILGLIISTIGVIFIREIAVLLGAEGKMLEETITYGRILLIALPAFMLQNVFQSFLVTAEKPNLGLFITIGAGLTNIVLDYVFIVIVPWGVAGAAFATGISQVVGGIIPLIYFLRKNSSTLKLTKTKYYGRILGQSCWNGSSELMTNVSMSLVNILYNIQLMNLVGEDGIAAYGVIMYVNFIFVSVFIGYSIGSAPIIGYHYGAENQGELKNLRKKSFILVGIMGIALTGVALLFAGFLSNIFVGYDKDLYDMTVRGFSLFSLSYLLMGFNIFGSSFFTALNNGLVSAIISFSRTLLFQLVAVFALPMILGLDGIWLAVVVAEVIGLFVTFGFIKSKKKVYGY